MKMKITRYIVTILFALIVALSLSGNISYADAIDQDNSLKGLWDKATGKKDLDDKVEKTKEDADPKYKEQKKQENTKDTQASAYAKVLFTNGNKSKRLMYYTAQTNAKNVNTVESLIYKKTKNKTEATQYASFLNSLSNWHLYSVQSNINDDVLYFLIWVIKAAYGSILLGCFLFLSLLETLKNILAHIVDYLNVWKYIADSSGSIPKNSPFYFLNPVVDIYHKLSVFAKVMLALFMGWIAFRLATGGGRANNRSFYLKNKGLKVLYALFAMALAASFASLSLSVASDMLKKSSDASTSAIEKIPKTMIVDTNQYINNSLTDIKGKKGVEGTNNGYVLNHDKGFPKTPDEVNNNIPTADLVEYMNTNGDKNISKKLSGKTLLFNWAYTKKLNANDIATMYNLDQKLNEKNNMNFLAFQLDPQPDAVKLTGDKKMFSTEKGAEVASSSLAGNTAIGVFLNALKMGAIILTVTAVIAMLYMAIFTGIANALKDFAINVSFSQMGLYQAFFGVFITGTILLVGIQLTLFLIQIFPDMILSIDQAFTKQLNSYTKVDGLLKQFGQTTVSLFALWILTMLVFKVRKGVMAFISNWFSHLLDAMNPQGSIAGNSRQDKKALENAINSNLMGQEGAEYAAQHPGETLGNGINDLKNKGKSLKSLLSDKEDEEKNQSVKSLMDQQESENQLDGEKTSEFTGKASASEEDADNNEASNKMEEDINEGLRNLGDTSEEGVARNLEEQDRRINDATNEFEKLNNAQEELDNARNDLANLKENGAPESDILAAEQRVADAEQAYNNQLGKSQEASRLLSRSGAGIEDIGASKSQAMRDYHDASNEIEDTEQKITDLTNEREEMEAFGASPAQLEKVDNRINKAKDDLAVSKAKQNLAQKAYESIINNPTAEKEARADLLQAQETQIQAARELEQATKHGNLTPEEFGTLQKAATSISSEVNAIKNDVDHQIRTNQVKENALKHMKDNCGKAFTTSDFDIQKNRLQNAEHRVESIQKQYNEAMNNPNESQLRIDHLSKELESAKGNYSNIQVASNAMNNGRNVVQALKAQEHILSDAYERKTSAEQSLNQLQSQEKSGVLTDRNVMKNTVSQLKQAEQDYSNTLRIISGLQAVKSIGSTQVPENKLQKLEQDNHKELNDLFEKQKEVSGVQSTIGRLGNGEKIDVRETHAISQVQKQARRKASEKVKEANDRYNDLKQKIDKLKKLEQSGVVVKPQVERYQSSLRQTKIDLDNAKKQEEFVSSQGFRINSVGKTMKNNYLDAKSKIQEATKQFNNKQKAHENILKTGGLSKEQLEQYKKDLAEEKQKSEANMQQFSRERAMKINAIKKELDV